MNKKQLVAKISSTLGQSKADAERTFDSITTIILDALKNDDTVKIAGFGTYKVAKITRFEKSLLAFFGLKDDLKSSQKRKTSNVPHLA